MGGPAWSVRDFILDRDIPLNLLVSTAEQQHLQRIEIPWVRIEPIYANAWSLTACIGWSAAVDATWRIRIELLDDKGKSEAPAGPAHDLHLQNREIESGHDAVRQGAPGPDTLGEPQTRRKDRVIL